MMVVILVRHGTHREVGKVLSGRSDIGLSEVGRAETRALVDALDNSAVASLHSSPRRRAAETIAPIAERRGLAVQTAPALDEIDFGTFAGRRFAELDGDPEWFRWNAERGSAHCPDGETMGEAIARASAYIQALSPQDSPAVCVTHCDIIRGLVAQQLGLSLDRLFAFDCAPASRTTLELSSGGVRLIALNERVR
jgi:broad specificity phosphatase PhoE